MDAKQQTRLSKFLSLVLRHDPERVGIELDKAGWVEIDTLLAACDRAGTAISRGELERIVAESDKQRFAISQDGHRIRANQGHSVVVDLGNEPAIPPETLFHGTAQRSLPGIRAGGLQKMGRHHVHLSATEATARAVGKRHGAPVILTVHSGHMHRAGMQFFLTPNGVWLAEAVLTEYIEFPKDG